jgi:peptidoglycan-associated lipoprotein
MKISNRLMPILFAVLFTYTGCAKLDVVKKDEALAPSLKKQGEALHAMPLASASKGQDKPVVTSVPPISPLNNGDIQKSVQSNEPTVTPDIRKALENIYFEFDSSTLSNSSRNTLTGNFKILKQSPLSKVRIEGHCDERGSDEYNLALGEHRAKAAGHYLTTLGIKAERIATVSYGEEKPTVLGHDEAAWAKNRRDEFIITQ